jgi:hypothetical protein
LTDILLFVFLSVPSAFILPLVPFCPFFGFLFALSVCEFSLSLNSFAFLFSDCISPSLASSQFCT